MGRICKTICPPGQEVRQLSGPKTVPIALSGLFEAEQDAGELAIGARQQHQATWLGLEAGGGNKPTLTLAKFPAHLFEVSTMNKPDRRRLRLAGACKNTMHVTPRYRARTSIGEHTVMGKNHSRTRPVYKLTSHYKDLDKAYLYRPYF